MGCEKLTWILPHVNIKESEFLVYYFEFRGTVFSKYVFKVFTLHATNTSTFFPSLYVLITSLPQYTTCPMLNSSNPSSLYASSSPPDNSAA
jgi:hypothetical protein